MKNILIILLFISIFFIQNTTAQSFCNTSSNYQNSISVNQAKTSNQNSYIVNIYFHIIRNSDGSGGQSTTVINDVLENLNYSFNPHKIYFNNLGYDIISDDYYMLNFNDDKFNALVNVNDHSNAIDLYLLANSTWNQGKADGIPGKAIVVGGNLYSSNLVTSLVVPHEVGHCLNLYHTHHGVFEDNCDELVDGSNCTVCGDFVCDTPADPGIFFDVSSNCEWTRTEYDENGDMYVPDMENIMSYSIPACMDYFSEGQGLRMRQSLEHNSILQDIVVEVSEYLYISGTDVLCSSNEIYTINNLSEDIDISWSSSSNITFPYGNTGSSVVAKANSSSTSGSGWIEASIDNSITLPRKEFWVGVPKILGGELNNPDDPEYTEVEYICQTYDYSAKNEIKILTGGTDSDVNYEWYKETTNFSYLAEDDVISIKSYKTGSIVFKVRADNVCGWSSWRTFAYPVIDCDDNGGGEELFFSASPNPANEFIEISLQEEEVMESSISLFGTSINSKQVESNEEYEIQIWHEQFGLVHRQKYSDKQIQIPTNKLANGIYFLHVIQNGEVYKQQIKVVH